MFFENNLKLILFTVNYRDFFYFFQKEAVKPEQKPSTPEPVPKVEPEKQKTPSPKRLVAPSPPAAAKEEKEVTPEPVSKAEEKAEEKKEEKAEEKVEKKTEEKKEEKAEEKGETVEEKEKPAKEKEVNTCTWNTIPQYIKNFNFKKLILQLIMNNYEEVF